MFPRLRFRNKCLFPPQKVCLVLLESRLPRLSFRGRIVLHGTEPFRLRKNAPRISNAPMPQTAPQVRIKPMTGDSC